ncbi:hypothetical protein AZI86_11940 [Bdellovibrio bacteriovorus]|uniref:Outer membrane protein beta-barrel domain-containing protein n=1 Tax=Bdellovibrio bacteriovorus TaxID=959 RepID=A0A150WMG0_BDEBC|nr:hypothetical protein [Bdellovibrio bacteriovorus]KYG64903.1 hypothetical protein AZI86_11940 [Bdellovibrio bacteriovorus]
MQIPKSVLFVLAISSALFTSTLVQAASDNQGDYQEVSYDDLLNELSAKKRAVTKTTKSDLDEVRLHAGIGYANSFTNIATQNQNFNRHAAGIQLSVGMDLFSPNWYSEGVFRNYGQNSSGSEEFSLREIDLKIGYTNKLESIWSYTLSSGLSNRFLKFSDANTAINVDETTPSLVISTGFMGQIHRNLSIGAEVGARSALVNRTADKNSFDFAFRLTTSL